jgi:YD repeat-containing protein
VGRIASRTDVFSGLTYASSYEYDLNDNLKKITYPSGRIVEYVYDIHSRLTEVKQNSTVFANQFGYDDAGRLASYRTGAVLHTVGFDDAQRVASITSGSPGDLVLAYDYDHVGSVKKITDPRPGTTQEFTLDLLDRVTTASGPWGLLKWTYDAEGNRQQRLPVGSRRFNTMRILGD